MLHTVEAFEAIVRQEVAVGYMTVVARRVTSMGGVAPCGIVRRHDVAVDAGCWIVPNDVGMHAQQVHEKRYEPHDDTTQSYQRCLHRERQRANEG